MSRVLLITVIWLTLAALVAGVAHLARPCGCALVREPSPARFSPAPGHSGAVATTVIAEPAPATPAQSTATPARTPATSPAPLPSRALAPAPVQPQSTAVAAAMMEPASATNATPIDAKQEPPTPPAHKPKRPPPDDPGDNGSNGGLGVLPKGVDPEYEGLGVMCVSVSTGRPIGDVQVRAMTTAELDAWSSAHPGQSVDEEDPKVVLEAAKPNAKTNAYGISITESGPGRMLVDARTGLLYAFAWVDRNKVSRVTLTMVEDHDLVFTTHSPDGSPRAGIPVVVSNAFCTEIWRGVTQGDDATVRMRHAGYLMERDPYGATCTANVEGVFRSPPSIALERGKLPSQNLDLFVPASHPLRVHVKDPQGKPVNKPFVVTLVAKDVSSSSCGYSSSRATQDGGASFDRVESLEDANFSVHLDGGNVFESTLQHLDASKDDVDVSFAHIFRVARMHIEDAAGKRLERGRVKAWLHLGSLAVPAGNGEFTTEPDGSLGIPLGHNGPWKMFIPVNMDALTSIVLVRLDPSGDPIASVEIPIPHEFKEGEQDFGTVRMQELPFIVQGYVVDDRDAAVPDARVAVLEGVPPVEGYANFPALDCAATSDSSGFFKLRGTLPEGDIDLNCVAPDHVMVPLAKVQRGDKKVRIVMSRMGRLVSKVLMPPGMPSDLVSVRVGSGEKLTTLRLDQGDIVHAFDLVPGKIDVSVIVAGIAKPVLSLQGVEVKPGVEMTDPRVVQIDLRERVFHRTLHVNDPDGKPINFVSGRVLEMSEDRRPPRKITGEAGVIRFVTTQASVDVNLSAPGFVTQELHGIDKDMDVTLERAP